MISRMIPGGICLVVVILALTARASAADAVKATDDGTNIEMDNGIVGLTIDKRSGHVMSMRYMANGKEVEMGNGGGALVYDYDAGNPLGNGTRHATPMPTDPSHTKIISQSDDSAEVAVECEPTEVCPFHSELHLILHRGQPGFYMWLQYRHTDKDPGGIMEQTRIVIRPIRGTSVFTNYVANETHKGPFPSGKILSTPFDTTWVYAEDGIAHSKYETVNYVYEDLVHGMAGNGLGIWLIQPSREFVNGGPLRQELTVHQDSPTAPNQNNILLWMLQGNHFGGPRISLNDNQVWSRFYGPAYVYMNQGPSVGAMWEDAKQVGHQEEAKWPYSFVKNDDFPLDRGTVTGQVKLADGASTEGAWVVLSPAGDKDFNMSANGYEFWTKTDADGKFTIPNVRPEQYTLFVSGADQFEDFVQENVSVVAKQTDDLGVLNWTPIKHGQRLWQIGVADHSSAEFKNGDDYRHFDNDARYIKSFPEDVTFTIGKSKENQDWNFSQWGWYAKRPYWSILFDEATAQSGKATLTIGFTAFDYWPGLQVEINGQKVGKPITFPKTGMAAYRVGRQDSQYHYATVSFDAGLIKAGTDEMHLIMNNAGPYESMKDMMPNGVGAVMYDAVRLEVDPTAVGIADPDQTINLWAGLPPGEKPATQPESWNPQTQMLSNVSMPTMAIYRPLKTIDTGTTVLICPGGGFTGLAMEHEGGNVAEWLNSIGVTAVLLKYRVPNHDPMPRYLAGLQDTERAMCLLRAHAKEWSIDPQRIGIVGFSAGGRIVADITTNLDQLAYDAVDDADKQSFRPDFAMAIYPGGVVLKDAKGANLPDLTPDVHPTKETPPTFLAIATDDRNGSENAVYYYLALKNAGVNAELHIYSEGGHGFGIRPSKAPHATWIDRAQDWMIFHGYVKPVTSSAM